MKKVNSTVLVILFMALISLLCLLLGVTYSYILSNGSAAANTETINTSNLNATITYNVAQYGNMQLTSDSEASNLSKYATIDIQKNNQYSVFYQLNLEYSSTYKAEDLNKYLPLENLKVALYKMNGNQVEQNPIVGPIRIADLPVVKCDSEGTTGILKTQYQLYVGKFNSGSQTTKYALKAWVADDTDEEFNGKTVSLDITINQEPYHSKNVYNLTFNNTTGAEIYLNGQKASNNKFTNVVEGTYTLIAKTTNKTYETALTITAGNTVGIKQIPPTITEQQALIAIQKLAYDNKTTVYQIMRKNPSIQNSNILTQYKLYNLPTSYELTLKPSLDTQEITGIGIILNDSGNDITLSYNGASNTIQSEGSNIFESVVPSVEISDGYEEGVSQP